jgi:hypothetical protein
MPTLVGQSGPPSPAFSRGSSLEPDGDPSIGPDGSSRIMRIKRLVRDDSNQPGFSAHVIDYLYQINGEWRTEIIRDPAVIRAYVRGRQVLEEEATLADSLAPTGDADKDKRAKKRRDSAPIPRDCG